MWGQSRDLWPWVPSSQPPWDGAGWGVGLSGSSADGSLSLEDDTGRVEELQGLLEKQNYELSQARERLVTLSATVTELEGDLGTARRDLIKSEELSSKHQRDLREVGEGGPGPALGGCILLGTGVGPPEAGWTRLNPCAGSSVREMEGVGQGQTVKGSTDRRPSWACADWCWWEGQCEKGGGGEGDGGWGGW